MDKAKSFLKEWVINFIKNKDLILKKLVSIEQDKGDFEVVAKYKDKEQFFIVEPIINNLDEILTKFSGGKHYGLVVFNTVKNFNMLIENWKKLIKFRFLCIYFVNPFSSLDKKWLIFPYTHHKICDEASLKTGLKTAFEMVDTLTEEDIETKF